MFRNIAEDATIEVYFDTFDSNGEPVAPSSAFTASDFAIYKNGSSTAKATTNGISVASPFNSQTGTHRIIIDTSNDIGDTGFWGVGDRYQVKFNTAKTVDGKIINGRSLYQGSFGIQSEYMRGTNAAALASGVLVSSLADNVITAASIATGAFTAAKFASGAFDAVWTVATRTLTGFGSLISDIWSNASRAITGTVTLATSQPNYAPAKAGDAMTLTSGERTAVANEVEAQIIDDTDSERVLQAIVDKIAEANPSLEGLTLAAIASAIRTELATELSRIDQTIGSRATQSSVDVIDDYIDTEMAATKSAAESAKTAAESVDTKLSNLRLTKIDNSAQTGADSDTLETLSDQLDALQSEVEKVPRLGETYRHRRVAEDSDEHSADVVIEEAA